MIYYLIIFGTAVFIAWKMYEPILGSVWECLLGFFLGAILGIVVSLFVVWTASATLPSSPVLDSSAQIKALNDASTVRVSFFLGSGTANGEIEYRFMVEDGAGVRMKTVSAEDAVVYDTTDTPHLETYVYRLDSAAARFFFGEELLISDEYRIYVPADTVKYDFNIDLE